MSSLEERQRDFASTYRISYENYIKLVSSMRADDVITCLELLRAKKHKSNFRADMEFKIRRWLNEPVIDQSRPMTDREFAWALPKWPVKIQLPT